jgi:hypothetical protein
MPRGKPTSIVEQRITLGTFERQWIVEQEDYLKSQVTQAKVAVLAVPVGIAVAGSALAYGIYLAGGKVGAGLSQIDFDIPNPLNIIRPVIKPVWDTIDALNPMSQGAGATARKAALVAEFLTWIGIDPPIADE